MKEKVTHNKSEARRILNFGPVTLLSSAHKGQQNVAAVAWVMPVSSNPALVTCALTKSRFSYELIHQSQEFVLNIPPVSLHEAVVLCGSSTGKDHDKFFNVGLTPEKAKKVSAPIVEECVAHIECKVVQEVEAGDHVLFIGEVVTVQADKGIISDNGLFNIEKARPLIHLGADRFAELKAL